MNLASYHTQVCAGAPNVTSASRRLPLRCYSTRPERNLSEPSASAGDATGSNGDPIKGSSDSNPSQDPGRTGKTKPRRHYSQNRAWQLHSYGGPQELQMNDSVKIPVINSPSQVVVKVHAASVNPIDVLMTNGYGNVAINFIRALESVSRNWTTFPDVSRIAGNLLRNHIEFPLVLGRDFAGVVEQVGHSVQNVKVGDEVFGVIGIQDIGSHTDHTVVSSNLVIQFLVLPLVSYYHYHELNCTINTTNFSDSTKASQRDVC